MNTQKGSAHVVIVVSLVVLLIGSLGFVFWQNFIQTDDNKEKTEKVATREQAAEPVASDPKKAETVDETGYSFEVVDGFSKSSEQMFVYTGGLKAQTTYVNDAGDFFEVLTLFGGGSGINADYFWKYDFNGSQLSITESDRCTGEGIGCLNKNGTVEGIISGNTSNLEYYLAFGNKTKNDTDLTFVRKFTATFRFK